MRTVERRASIAPRMIEPASAGARPVIETAAGRPEIVVVMVMTVMMVVVAVVAVVGLVIVPAVQIHAEGVAADINTADAVGDHGKTGGGVDSGPLVDGGAWRVARAGEQAGQPLEQSHGYLLSL